MYYSPGSLSFLRLLASNVVGFSVRNTFIYKFANFARRQFQHLASKHGNFTNYRMTFRAVVKNFVRLEWMKIYSKMQTVHDNFQFS